MREDEEELYAQGVAGVFAGEEVHLARKALFLLGPNREMPPALRGAVFDLHEDEGGATGKSEIGLCEHAGVAAHGQPALRDVDGEREFFGHPATQMGVEALGKAMERR